MATSTTQRPFIGYQTKPTQHSSSVCDCVCVAKAVVVCVPDPGENMSWVGRTEGSPDASHVMQLTCDGPPLPSPHPPILTTPTPLHHPSRGESLLGGVVRGGGRWGAS
ncbi:hypothetical protein E2C01_031746 [Portunus trituberculatus]|uniref:Uncharacterized protein n=1 Tax=Portunus trituberculatus TaxID=210409 RepID=A0A5B7ETJ7_PORTR|nr:hypothetical protein [Portunus trituberculatus]